MTQNEIRAGFEKYMEEMEILVPDFDRDLWGRYTSREMEEAWIVWQRAIYWVTHKTENL